MEKNIDERAFMLSLKKETDTWNWLIGRSFVYRPDDFYNINGWFHNIIWFRKSPIPAIINELFSHPKDDKYKALEVEAFLKIVALLEANYAR